MIRPCRAEHEVVVRTPLDLINRVFVGDESLESVLRFPLIPHDHISIFPCCEVEFFLARVEIDGVDLALGPLDFDRGNLGPRVPAASLGLTASRFLDCPRSRTGAR